MTTSPSTVVSADTKFGASTSAAADAGLANPTSAPSASTEAVAPAMSFLRRDLNETLCPELICDILVPPKEIVINGQVRPVLSVFSQG
jgi:hypothetical protein